MSSLFGNSSTPSKPDYSAAMEQWIQGYGSQLPYIVQQEGTYTPELNAISNAESAKAMTAYQDALANTQLAAISQYAPQVAAAQLAYNAQYAPQAVDQQMSLLRQADPAYWSMRDTYAKQVGDDLALGNQLSGAQTRQVEQNTRAAQAARGNLNGNAVSAQEVLGKFLAGETLKTQRQQTASNFLTNNTVTPDLSGFTMPSASSTATGQGFTTNNGYFSNAASNLASQGANAATQNYNAQLNYAGQQVSPFASIFGTVTSGLGTAASLGWNPFGTKTAQKTA